MAYIFQNLYSYRMHSPILATPERSAYYCFRGNETQLLELTSASHMGRMRA